MKWTLYLALATLLSWGCKPEVKVFAPEQEAFVAYGVLDPDLDSQFVRVSVAFQTDGDAYVAAANRSVSADELELSLIGNGMRLVSTPLAVTLEPGPFNQQSFVYFFETKGAQKLVPGEWYQLQARRPGQDSVIFSASTTIPTQPTVTQPSNPIYFPNSGIYKLPRIDFTDDFVAAFWNGSGKGFELRVWLDVEVDGQLKTIKWGPTPLFYEPVRCAANFDAGKNCYEIPEMNVVNVLRSALEKESGTVTFDDSRSEAFNVQDLDDNVRFEVTAVDSFLSDYLYANQPFGFGFNLLLDKPEYTNVTGRHIGIFGSIHRGQRLIQLDDCTKYLIGLTSSRPTGCE